MIIKSNHFKSFFTTLFLLNSFYFLKAQVITQTLSYTGGAQTFSATSCMQATISCYGAKGADGTLVPSGSLPGTGGLGALAEGVISLRSGDLLNIYIGGTGTGTVGGFNGGGNSIANGAIAGAGAGGGATDIRLNGSALINRIIIAGGGGGGGNGGGCANTVKGGNGGNGGGGVGIAGVNSVGGGGGQGGNGTTGGAAGIGCSFATGTVALNGTIGIGGTGGKGFVLCNTNGCGGGGGGGYFGGGGGGGGSAGTTSCTLNDTGAGGGGAGGTNYFSSSVTNTAVTNGINNGAGYVIISYSIGVQPTVTVNSGAICSGNSFTISPSGALTYTYSSGSSVVSPTATTNYTVTGASALGCINTAISSVSINPTPTITVNSGAICSGNSFTISPTGASTYTYSGGSSVVSPTATASYTITGASAFGCTNTAVSSVTVNSVPTLTVNSGAICSGNSFTISPTGASTYTYSGGSSVVNPTVTSSYTVTGASALGCTNTAISSVTVNSVPTITVNNGAICSGNSFTITPTGASTYTYSGGSSVVSPTATTNYTVTGASALGCTNTAVSTVTVNSSPTLTVNSGTICSGNSFTITPSGASTYTYSGGSSVVSPTTTTSYTITGESVSGCTNTAMSNVTVNSLPILSISPLSSTICAGQNANMAVFGATSYTWSNGSNLTSITVNPSVTTTYSVIGSNASGCLSTGFTTITVNALPTVSITGLPTICNGIPTTLTASGASTYTWSTGVNTTSITVNPIVITSYSVIGTDVNGCMNSAIKTVSLFPVPVITVNSGTICLGQSFTLVPSGALTYTFSSGTNVVTPSSNTTYSVTGTSAAGCVSAVAAVSSVTVNANPTVNIGADTEVGLGDSYQFTPTQTGAVSYAWLPSTYLNASNIINPITTPESDITYTLTVTSINGCTASDEVNIKVLAELIIANFMSPNGDGNNDTWKVNVPALIRDYSIEIIDGYGQSVYSKANNYNNEFDGTKSGQALPDGVYYYFIKEGSNVKHKGTITITK